MSDVRKVLVGGSFAPPMDAAKLTSYEALATALPESHARDGMVALCKMMRAYRKGKPSTREAEIHPALDRAVIIPLEEEEVRRIWDLVPWPGECDTLGAVFDQIDPVSQSEIRNAAFHLLWFARELTRDREPITNDKL